MKKREFRKILVGVDLSRGDSLVSDELPPPTREALVRATRLAQLSQGELHFFFALDVSPQAQELIDRTKGLAENILDKSQAILRSLEEDAKELGIRTRSTVVFGKSGLELIRQVLREESDLLVVGTRHLGRLHGTLVGSTGMGLLRKCPCPVWITQPLTDSALEQILVATDFSPVCELAIDIAATLATIHGAELHLLHAFDFPHEASLKDLLTSRDEYHQHRQEAEQQARAELHQQRARPSLAGLRKDPASHIVSGEPSEVIRDQLEELKIDLLVMGTVARSGISGLLMGNTAERLLPQVDCSILAVKPPGYKSPITL